MSDFTYIHLLATVPLLFAGALSIWSAYVAVMLPLLLIRALRKYLKEA